MTLDQGGKQLKQPVRNNVFQLAFIFTELSVWAIFLRAVDLFVIPTLKVRSQSQKEHVLDPIATALKHCTVDQEQEQSHKTEDRRTLRRECIR